ncbi:hypothetical protein HanRHA438_Chr02g0051941 [Helianthus annuus]|nr:hypothetical protein HanIR_Chr02g0056691 [Helianthus annuus]KAJ0938631.1 hypothetical protein HanRHA438_Chr02g0051941 [Helianthus annuus]
MTLSVKIQNPFDHEIQFEEKPIFFTFFFLLPQSLPTKSLHLFQWIFETQLLIYFENHTQMRWVKWVNTGVCCFLFFYCFNVQ